LILRKKQPLRSFQKEIIGLNKKVPLVSGKYARYINLDNAASTPALKPVVGKVMDFLEWYSSVHRGTGYKSVLSTKVYDEAHETVAQFVGADISNNTVIFVKNTTEAINKLANRLDFNKRDIVITTQMEHHSNDLPWRKKAKTLYIGVDNRGSLLLDDLEDKLKNCGNRVRIVAVSGASNVTGHVNNIYKIAEMAHHHGAELLVDAAQLVPHRPVDILPNDDPRHIDYIAFSAHKMYAPFGTGVLIGPTATFARGAPDYAGGGTIETVSLEDIQWAPPPERDEAGTPNLIGALALVEAIKVLQKIGMERIYKHEKRLTSYALGRLKEVNNIIIYGDEDLSRQDRVGVITFNLKGINHALVAAVLSYEGGIAVRNGCFCAHPYVHHLLKLNKKQIYESQKKILMKKKQNLPGMVRISFGLYNTFRDIDTLISLLKYIEQKIEHYKNSYCLNLEEGSYYPETITKSPWQNIL